MNYERMRKEAQKIDEEICAIETQIKQFPPGKLICTRSGKYYKWYQSDGKHWKYIPKSKRNLAEQLAAKKYLSCRLKDLQKERTAVDFYLRHCSSDIPRTQQLLEEVPEYQNLLSSVLKPTSDELADWMIQPYEKNPYYQERLIYKGHTGNLLRSKSEVLIEMLLIQYQIPYRYECALQLGDHTIYPDFTIRHPVTGEVLYWEHFGMMDDVNYSKNVPGKLHTYITAGIIPSINLITTYETKDNPLSMELVEKTIKYYFL